jgi:hypothetical protein
MKKAGKCAGDSLDCRKKKLQGFPAGEKDHL